LAATPAAIEGKSRELTMISEIYSIYLSIYFMNTLALVIIH